MKNIFCIYLYSYIKHKKNNDIVFNSCTVKTITFKSYQKSIDEFMSDKLENITPIDNKIKEEENLLYITTLN